MGELHAERDPSTPRNHPLRGADDFATLRTTVFLRDRFREAEPNASQRSFPAARSLTRVRSASRKSYFGRSLGDAHWMSRKMRFSISPLNSRTMKKRSSTV